MPKPELEAYGIGEYAVDVDYRPLGLTSFGGASFGIH
jgi:hypothetical protein